MKLIASVALIAATFTLLSCTTTQRPSQVSDFTSWNDGYSFWQEFELPEDFAWDDENSKYRTHYSLEFLPAQDQTKGCTVGTLHLYVAPGCNPPATQSVRSFRATKRSGDVVQGCILPTSGMGHIITMKSSYSVTLPTDLIELKGIEVDISSADGSKQATRYFEFQRQ
ncbi:MAG: hypothetical protein IT462_08415 [Planctomycetes bacterium]|nr:hypothetical protein [Planctomycetota bacterium]